MKKRPINPVAACAADWYKSRTPGLVA